MGRYLLHIGMSLLLTMPYKRGRVSTAENDGSHEIMRFNPIQSHPFSGMVVALSGSPLLTPL